MVIVLAFADPDRIYVWEAADALSEGSEILPVSW